MASVDILTEQKEEFYRQMVLVRYFEERVLDLFSEGALFGTTHCYIGQEANASAVLNHLRQDDIVVSNHRCHGHYLVRTGDVDGLMAELMGKPSGVSGGLGGSQQLCNGNFFTSGILGSNVPIAAGMAYAEKVKQTGRICVLFIGDGTFGEGLVYESFNMVSLWNVPILIVVENNRYAQTTALEQNFAGSFQDRAQAFDITTGEIESNDVEELFRRFEPIVRKVREESRPHVEILHTYRLSPHSKGDDFRPQSELDLWHGKDPLKILAPRIAADRKKQFEDEAIAKIEHAVNAAKAIPFQSVLNLPDGLPAA